MVKSILRALWQWGGNTVADVLPGIVLIFAIYRAFRARKMNFSTFVWLAASVVSYFWCYQQLPQPFDTLNFPRPQPLSAGMEHRFESDAKTTPPPVAAVTPKPPGDAFRNQRYRVTKVPESDSLRIRKGPGMHFDEIGQLARDTSGVEIVGAPVSNELDLWAPIAHGTLRGWVHAQYLEVEDQRGDSSIPLQGPTNARPQQGHVTAGLDPQLIKKLEYHCVKHFNTEGQWAADYQIVGVKQSRVEDYDGKKATIRLEYAFAVPGAGVRGDHQRVFRLRWTWGDFWQVHFISDPIEGPFPKMAP